MERSGWKYSKDLRLKICWWVPETACGVAEDFFIRWWYVNLTTVIRVITTDLPFRFVSYCSFLHHTHRQRFEDFVGEPGNRFLSYFLLQRVFGWKIPQDTWTKTTKIIKTMLLCVIFSIKEGIFENLGELILWSLVNFDGGTAECQQES